MARRRSTGTQGQRVNNYNARPIIRLTAPNFSSSTLLQQIEDRRTFHPDPYRPASLFESSRHRLEATPQKVTQSSSRLPSGVTFQDAKHVLVCVRRKVRKEVIFALGKSGRGHGGSRRKRSMYSDVGC